MTNDYVNPCNGVISDFRFLLRRDGNTTRIVDNAIQLLFRGERVVMCDHHEGGINRGANDHLTEIVAKRLSIEHGIAVNSQPVRLMVEIENNSIFLKLEK